MGKLHGKVIVITGASAGIGAALVREGAKQGANVLLTARREGRLAALVAELAHLPGKRIVLAGDIQDEAFCHQLIEAAVAEFGRIDILINNAGLGHRSSIETLPSQDMLTIAHTNIFGLVYTSQAAARVMRKQGSGTIVQVSSIVGQRPMPYGAFYAASKTCVNFLSRGLRMELRGSGVNVTVVYPGVTRTEFQKAILADYSVERKIGTSAEKVAKITMRAVTKGKKEVYISFIDWAFTHANRLFPNLFDFIFGIFRKPTPKKQNK